MFINTLIKWFELNEFRESHCFIQCIQSDLFDLYV